MTTTPVSRDLRIAVVLGSIRPGRLGARIAAWVVDTAATRSDAQFELVDLADFDLPHLDEPVPPMAGDYRHEHTRAWAKTVEGYDGFVFVTPEYNHSTSGALKNALDYLYAEWNDKAAAFVGYGVSGGLRAVEHLRGITAELQLAGVRTQLEVNLRRDLAEDGSLRPDPDRETALHTMLDQLVRWAGALAPLRSA